MLRTRRLSAAIFAVALLPAASFAAQGDAPDAAVAPFVSVDAKSVAIVHVRVIDGTGSAARSDQTVVFSNGTITASGPWSPTSVPPGALTIDGTGKTVLPGYVGTHNHLFTGVGPRGHHYWRSMPFSFPRLYLAAGTTTIRTTGSMDIFADIHLKQSIDAGQTPGPSMDLTSPYLTGPGNDQPQMDELRDAVDGKQTVDYWADRGVTSFKVYTNISTDALGGVIAEAHARGLKVMGHLCSVGYRAAAALGIDSLEHGPYFTDTDFVAVKTPNGCPDELLQETTNAGIDPNDPRMSALIEDLIQKHVAVSSTLPVFESAYALPTDAAEAPTLALLDPEQQTYVEAVRTAIADPNSPGLLALEKTYPNIVADERTLLAHEMAFEVRFARAGGLLTCGPDPSGYGAVIAGLGDWREIELLVQAGLSPVEAIHVATENGATELGRADKIGTIAPGKTADLILIDGDPSTNIADIEKVETVFKAGTGYDSKKLIDSVKGLVGRI